MPRLLFAILLLMGGCASYKIRAPAYTAPAAPPPASFVAAAAKVDITPPPGFPLGGHSIAGRMARGYWTRLYARAFFFRDIAGRSLALVTCDLFAMPAALQAEVARRVARENVPLSPDSLIISAIHTHHGPGNFMSSAVYNFGGLIPGFDPALFDFLAGRIAMAVVQAAEEAARSASIPHRVALHTGFALNIQRNRALDPFLRNPAEERNALLEDSRRAGMTCAGGAPGDCPRYQGVDPTLVVLEVLRQERRIALLAFFAVHPEGMSHDSPLYSSDLAGRAMTLLEHDQPAGSLVAGFFNGAEGDVSPRWKSQDREDVLRFGGLLADSVRRVLQASGPSSGSPEIRAASESFAANPAGPDTREFTRPEIGAAQFGGAEDGRTAFYPYGWRGGVVRKGSSDPKMPALQVHDIFLLKILKPFLASPSKFPAALPVSIARIGQLLTVGAVPVEMTTLMGRRVRASLAAAESPREVVLAGLANEYLSYTTTPEEYDLQNYEGASTLFGKQQGPVIQRLLAKVSAKPPPQLPQAVPAAAFDAGPKVTARFGPRFFGERRNSPVEDLEAAMPDALGRVDDRAPRFEWDEKAATDWATSARSVTILKEDSGAWAVFEEEDGGNLLTILIDGIDKRHWGAVWLPPAGADRAVRYRFRVQTPEPGVVKCSEPFRPGDPEIKSAPSCPEVR